MDKKFIANDTSVIFDGKVIFKSEAKVLTLLNVDQIAIIILDLKKNNQNVIAINREGKQLWTIEQKEYHQSDCSANNVYVETGRYLIYRWCGIEEEFDIKTGSILSSTLIK